MLQSDGPYGTNIVPFHGDLPRTCFSKRLLCTHIFNFINQPYVIDISNTGPGGTIAL
jgi:hypothetical protein